MPFYKIRVSYTNPTCEELMSVDASSVAEALSACDGIRKEIEGRMSSMAANNIYCSKVLASCEVAKKTLKEDLESIKWLKDHV